jgi:nucleoside-diphosphate-sugar epimerase
MSGAGLEGKRIALVGGAGFIGHHLALRLRADGAEVDVIDSLAINNLRGFTADPAAADFYRAMLEERLDLLRDAGVRLHLQDAREGEALGRVLGECRPAALVHLAAVAHAVAADRDPGASFEHGMRSLHAALEAARGRVEQFVYFSSSMAYGNFRTDAVDEEHPLEPVGVYGALKVAGERLVVAYRQVFGLPYTILRPSALYGPRCISRRVAQIFIENALHGRPLRIEGEGDQRLDFTCVDDLADGVLLCLTRPEALNEIFNLTFGASRSLAELAGIVAAHFPGTAIERVPGPRLTPRRGTLKVDKARALLGYQPSRPLEIGLPQYIGWYKQFAQQHVKSNRGS